MTTITSAFLDPWGSGFQAVQDFWGFVLGSPEQKAIGVSHYIPLIPNAPNVTEQWRVAINTQKASSPELKQTWETPKLGDTNITLPNITLPDFGEIGKWLLLGGLGIAGIWLLGKYLGGRK